MKRLTIVGVLLTLLLAVSHAQEDDILVFGWEQEAQNLYPLNGLTYAGLLENFYARDLWDWDSSRTPYPIMVTELPTTENGMVAITDDGDTEVTIQLREGMLWSDGEAITAEDCQLWHEIRMDPSTSPNVSRATYPDIVSSFEILDELSFKITYSGAFPDYLGAAERPQCRYPEHIWGPILDEYGTLDDSPYFTAQEPIVGYGPYRMVSWDIGVGWSFEVNEYWDGTVPAYERIEIRVITDDAQMRNSLATGAIDVAFGWSDDLQSVYAEIENIVTFSTPGVNSDALWMRTGEIGNDPEHGGDALNDERVRRAIVHAIDRVTLAEQLVAPGIEVPRSWYAPQWIPDDLPLLEYDPELAASLLDEAGWLLNEETGIREKDGITLDNLRLVTTENTLRNNYQLVIQEYLAEVGIGVDLQIVPAGTMFAGYTDRGTLTTYEWEMTIFFAESPSLSPGINPSSYTCGNEPSADNPTGFNVWQFCNPRWEEVNSLIQETFPGPERDALIAEAVTLRHEGYFWHGLRVRATWYAINTANVNVDGIQEGLGTQAFNWFHNIEYWQPAE